MSPTELDNRFTYHAPKPEQVSQYNTIRYEARHLARMINDMCPESAEKLEAIVNLEQAVMWANAAIARHS